MESRDTHMAEVIQHVAVTGQYAIRDRFRKDLGDVEALAQGHQGPGTPVTPSSCNGTGLAAVRSHRRRAATAGLPG